MLNFEESILYYCAPTLEGVKASSMFSIRFQNQTKEEAYSQYYKWKKRLQSRGVSIIVLSYKAVTNTLLLLVYREEKLSTVINSPKVLDYLIQNGYPDTKELSMLLDHVSKRCQNNDSFPHEIGFFLDYPIQDVIGFIDNNGNHFTCSGLWKSYSDPHIATQLFEVIRNCTKQYWKRYYNGKSLMQLIPIM